MSERELPGTRVRVTLDTGDTFDLRVTNRELIAWDMTRQKQKWPAWSDANFLALTFVAHRAALREKVTDLTWTQWQESVEDIESLEVDPEVDVTRPTRPAPEPGSR